MKNIIFVWNMRQVLIFGMVAGGLAGCTPATGNTAANFVAIDDHGDVMGNSPLAKVPISVAMPREQLEALVAEATGKASNYNVFTMYDQTEAEYYDGQVKLMVKFKHGYPHGMGMPGQDSIPGVDATVISWKLKPMQ